MASISPQSLPIVVGYAFMAKKMSSMGKVLNNPSDDPSQDQEQVVFDPFVFDEEGSTVTYARFDFTVSHRRCLPQAYNVIIHKLSEDIMLQHERAESKLKLDQLRRYLSLVRCAFFTNPTQKPAFSPWLSTASRDGSHRPHRVRGAGDLQILHMLHPLGYMRTILRSFPRTSLVPRRNTRTRPAANVKREIHVPCDM